MKAIMVMFDSLNRHMLPSYGCDWVQAPNFARLAKRTTQFIRSYVCSMPCMPARRDLHTGRPNFLHRAWGPLEPFDDSVPQLLKQAGVHTHLATDHYHYFEDGGGTYHTKYSTWEFFRGQEGDPWKGQVVPPPIPNNALGSNRGTAGAWLQDRINRQFIREEQQWPQVQTFAAGIDYIRRNAIADRWCLQIETFDPHEPFYSYPPNDELVWDWPAYDFVKESPELVEHMRRQYGALVSMCDTRMGQVLDLMDELDLWKDTMLIVWTDHGFLLGEHECWAKIWMPFYEEVAHTPFFVWDPRSAAAAGQMRESLVQPSIDLGPTLLEYFELPATKDMTGRSLREVIASDRPVREAGIFGLHGAQVNVTDGRYVYMHAAVREDNQPLYEYTHMPTRMRGAFRVDELAGKIELAEPFGFTKGCRTMRIPAGKPWVKHPDVRKNLLYDLQSDPWQKQPVHDAAVEARMVEHLRRLMRECDAPVEQFARLGL
ncbi:MAG: sulfatase-like hydrolase/transferase [Verrucomicrobiota bacterium]